MEDGKKISFHGREAKILNSFQGKVTPKHYISVRNKKGERYKVVNISEIPNPYSKDSLRFHPYNGVCVGIRFNRTNEDEIKSWLSDLGYKKQPPKED